jgi:hypothetical protein
MSKRGARLAGMFDWPRLVVNVESLYEKALAAVTP